MEGIKLALGCPIRDDYLRFAKRMGMEYVQTNAPIFENQEYWTYDELARMVDKADSFGLKILSVENTPAQFYDKLLWGLPGKERQLDHYRTCIENVGRVGIPIMGYHFMPTSVWRDVDRAMVHGDVAFTAYHHQTIDRDGPQPHNLCDPSLVGAPEEKLWENYEYFIKGILPTAAQANVKLAMHPDDPPVREINGVKRLFYSVEQFKKAWELVEGHPNWGLDFCMGSISELDGAASVGEFIDFFAPKGAICYCHFRDVSGCMCSPEQGFHETFLGEGNYDPAEMLLRLHRQGFAGHLIDDHVGAIPDDPGNFQAHAQAIGYMQGLVRMADYLNK